MWWFFLNIVTFRSTRDAIAFLQRTFFPIKNDVSIWRQHNVFLFVCSLFLSVSVALCYLCNVHEYICCSGCKLPYMWMFKWLTTEKQIERSTRCSQAYFRQFVLLFFSLFFDVLFRSTRTTNTFNALLIIIIDTRFDT